ncbi:hypothetical protein B0H13DRAFT_1853763 [Mycena leptocephala]|nr:hypothetical protein B0H13DRAFT_1853763 [Mycena leptocephala]
MPHLKGLKSLLQSSLAILEQGINLTLAEEILEHAALLLSFNKGVDFVEGPDNSATYSVNFPIVRIDVNHQNYIQQLRLNCVRDGCQGALQAAGKNFQSICSDGQTCCNVVESNLSDSGLGRHLGDGSRVSGDIEFLSCVIGNLPLNGYWS